MKLQTIDSGTIAIGLLRYWRRSVNSAQHDRRVLCPKCTSNASQHVQRSRGLSEGQQARLLGPEDTGDTTSMISGGCHTRLRCWLTLIQWLRPGGRPGPRPPCLFHLHLSDALRPKNWMGWHFAHRRLISFLPVFTYFK